MTDAVCRPQLLDIQFDRQFNRIGAGQIEHLLTPSRDDRHIAGFPGRWTPSARSDDADAMKL